MTSLIAYDDLLALLTAIFVRHGVSAPTAALVAADMAAAERDGALSHGIFRVAGNLASLTSGWLDGKAVPVVEDVAPGMIRVDGRNGFAQAGLAATRELLMAKARTNGIAVLTMRKSHHFGALWPDIEPFARQGFLAMMMVNSMASVVPHGGNKKLYGTNPLGFAVPRAGHEPLIFDQASSAWSNGDVQIARREGRQLPPGVGVDSAGQPTTDPNAVLEGGALLPFGGHKGSSVAMLMEVMAAGLAGSNFSFEVDWSAYPGAATPDGGQTIILIDPGRGHPGSFAERMETLIAAIHDAGQDRLPADRRYANRRKALAEGVPIATETLAELRRLAH